MKTNEKRGNSKSNFVGRRTGIDIKSGKTIRKHEDGTDMFEDYWTDSDEEIHLSVQEPQGVQVDDSNRTPNKVLSEDGVTKSTQNPVIIEVAEDRSIHTEVVPEKKRVNGGSSSKQKTQVKKKNKSVGIKNSHKDLSATRRSTRNRIAPLEYWRNERVRYQFTESGGIKILGLEKGVADQSHWSKKSQNKFYRNKKTKKSHKRDDDIKGTYDFLENGITVIDPETREEVSADLVREYKSLAWKTPKGSVSANPDSFAISKSFQCDKIATGFLKLPPLEEKPAQYLPSDDVIFTIIHGKVQVLIHETVLKLQNNDTFIVPQGNPYSVKNLGREEALLSFLTIKQALLEQLIISNNNFE